MWAAFFFTDKFPAFSGVVEKHTMSHKILKIFKIIVLQHKRFLVQQKRYPVLQHKRSPVLQQKEPFVLQQKRSLVLLQLFNRPNSRSIRPSIYCLTDLTPVLSGPSSIA